MAQFGAMWAISPKYLGAAGGARQAEQSEDVGCGSPGMVPSCVWGLLGRRLAQAAGGLRSITGDEC